MSTQNDGKLEVVRLVTRLGDDPSFARLFENQSKAEQIALAEEHGFRFTCEDLDTVLKSAKKVPSTNTLSFDDPTMACCSNSAKATRVLGCIPPAD
ncbi:Nif11-like leader peptide family natural product precursor [Gloeocapsa sp. BRSZ]